MARDGLAYSQSGGTSGRPAVGHGFEKSLLVAASGSDDPEGETGDQNEDTYRSLVKESYEKTYKEDDGTRDGHRVVLATLLLGEGPRLNRIFNGGDFLPSDAHRRGGGWRAAVAAKGILQIHNRTASRTLFLSHVHPHRTLIRRRLAS